MYKSVKTLPFLKLTFISRRAILSLSDSQVNLIQGSTSLRLFKKIFSFSSPCVHIKKISSMYLSHTKGCNCCVSKKLASNLSKKKHAYGGANLLPIAVPETCCLTLLLKSNQLFFNTNSSILTKSFVGMHFTSCLSKAFLRALNPAS